MSNYGDSDNEIEEVVEEEVKDDNENENENDENEDQIESDGEDLSDGEGLDDDNDLSEEELDEEIDLINDDDRTEIKDVSETIYEYYSKSKMTRNFLTKYERCRVLAKRTQQLTKGAPSMVSVSDCRSIREIAEKELRMRKIPFIIRRKLPNDTHEDWKLSELLI